jgi:protein-tyrosine kinase
LSNQHPRIIINPEVTPMDEFYRGLFLKIDKKMGPGSKSILITSAIKGEGKTTTIIQLAKVAARDFEKRVLLLEGDVKNPQLSGLVDITERHREDQAISETTIPGLFVMTLDNIIKNKRISGPVFGNGLKKIIEMVSPSYDYVLVDCPPVLPVVDTQIIAGIVDGIILLIRSEGPTRNLVRKAIEGIPKEKILGVVFNGAKIKTSKYIHPYNYK